MSERHRESKLTSAWWSWFWCRTSMTNSARRMTCSSFLAGVAKLATFSEAECWRKEQRLILPWLISILVQWISNVMITTMQSEEAKVINTFWACRKDNTVDDTHNTSREMPNLCQKHLNAATNWLFVIFSKLVTKTGVQSSETTRS